MKSKFNGSPPLTKETEARSRGPGNGASVSSQVRRVTCSVLAAVILSSAITSPFLDSHTVGDHYGEPKGIFERLIEVHAEDGSSTVPAGDMVSKMPEEGNSLVSSSVLDDIASYATDPGAAGAGTGAEVGKGHGKADKNELEKRRKEAEETAKVAKEVADETITSGQAPNIKDDAQNKADYASQSHELTGHAIGDTNSCEMYEGYMWYKLGTSKERCFGATQDAWAIEKARGVSLDNLRWWRTDVDSIRGVGKPEEVSYGDIMDFSPFKTWADDKYGAYQDKDVFYDFMVQSLECDASVMDTYNFFIDMQTKPDEVQKDISEIFAYQAVLRPMARWSAMNSTHTANVPSEVVNREALYELAPNLNGSKCSTCYEYAYKDMGRMFIPREYSEQQWPNAQKSGGPLFWDASSGILGQPYYNYNLYYPITMEIAFCGEPSKQSEDGTDPPFFPDDPTGGGTGSPGTNPDPDPTGTPGKDPPPPPWSEGDPDPKPTGSPGTDPEPDPPTNSPHEYPSGDNYPTDDPEDKPSGDNYPTGDPENPPIESGTASPGGGDEGDNGGENKSSDDDKKDEDGEHRPGTDSESGKKEGGDWRPGYSRSDPNPWTSGEGTYVPPSENSNGGENDKYPDRGDGGEGGEGNYIPPAEDEPTFVIPGDIKWPYTVCNCGGPCPGDGAERGVTCTEAGGQKCKCGNPAHTEKKGCNGSCGSKCDGSKDKCACPCDATIEWEPNEPTSKTPYKKLTIEGKVLVANFIENWDKRRPEDGNVFATGFEDIQDIEKHEDVPGCFAHSGSDSKTTKHPVCHTDQCGTDENPHPCAVSAETYQQNYCHSIYTFKWTPNPQTQMDEKELKMVPNMMYVTAPFTADEGAMIANKYIMTRKGDYPDIEFTNKGRIFDIYTFYNTNAWGNQPEVKVHTHEGPDGEDRYGSHIGPTWIDRFLKDYTLQLKPKNPVPAEPFRDPFEVSFLSHRFGKYMTEDLEGEVGDSKILPLAGYMEPTATNKDYKTWSEPREIYRRVMWYLDEQDQTNLDGMHKGTKPEGFNIRWGHGGDWGTVTGSDPMDPEGSDQIWNNDFSWSRQILGVYAEWSPSHFKWCEVEECDIHSEHEEKPENCPHHNTSNQFTAIADQLNSPRAEFLRTLVIQDTVYGEAKTCEADGFEYYARENEYGNDRITWHIPSTVFNFSPTYKMYGDYGPDLNPQDYHDIWMLASDADTVQFNDVVDLNITGGDVVVRSNWSRDFEDTNVKDPNRGTIINVLKAGNAYWVDTTGFKLEITAVVHYWDTNFWEPGSNKYISAVNDNDILREYEASLNGLMSHVSDDTFAYFTNLVGGTSGFSVDTSSRLRIFPNVNPKVFGKEPEGYSKLRLTYAPNFANQGKNIRNMNTSSDNRLDGGWDTWDSTWAQADGAAKWSESTYQAKVPDDAIHSEENLKSVLLTQDWYVEDYEAIKVKVFEGSVEIKQLRSSPAQVWERLSDNMTDTNKWSPELRHYLAERGPGEVPSVSPGRVLIEEGSVGAGTEFLVPTFRVFPDGIKGGGTDVHDFSMMLYPDVFGVRGSTFDN